MSQRITNLPDMLVLHEGLVLHAYRDSLGYWTVGVGRLVDPRKGASLPLWLRDLLAPEVRAAFDALGSLPLSVKKWPAARISLAQAERLLAEDILKHQKELRAAQPWIHQLDGVRQAVLDDMTFNMGIEPFDNDNVKDWPIFLGQVKRGDYAGAASNMLKTLWAKQVKSRAVRLAKMMETGQWPTE